jgi:hypothetical protein
MHPVHWHTESCKHTWACDALLGTCLHRVRLSEFICWQGKLSPQKWGTSRNAKTSRYQLGFVHLPKVQ